MTDAAKPDDSPFYVLGVRAEHFMAVELAELVFEPGGGLVQFSGPNASSKTGAMTAIESTLFGQGAVPNKPVTAGAERAQTDVRIGDGAGRDVLLARRVYGEDGKSSLEVRGADGVKLKSPQEVLNRLVELKFFNPVFFASPGQRSEKADNDARIEELLKICPLRINLANHDARTKELAEERKAIKRRADELEVLVKADAANVPEDGPPEDESVYVSGIARIGADEELRSRAKRRTEEIGRELDELDKEIKRLQEKREMLGKEWTRQGNLAVPPIEGHQDKGALEKKLAEVRARNDKRRQASADRTRAEERAKSLASERARVEKLDSQIVDMDNERESALSEAKFPVPQLTITSDGWLSVRKKDGSVIPFHQENTAKRIVCGFVVMAAKRPKLHACVIQQGNDLDHDSLRTLAMLAKKFDVKVFLERIVGDPSAGAVVEFRVGRVASVTPEAAS